MKSFLAVLLISGTALSGAVQFNRDIRPILSEHCFQCHGPDDKHRKAKLRLDTKEGLFTKHDHGSIVDPGNPGKSELIHRITTDDADDKMPPAEAKKPMSEGDIALLKQWIAEGASFQDHWAFVTPTRPDLPPVKGRDWLVNPLDHFILARLEKEGLTPNDEADRPTLIRRATLDLTGLPPTPAEVEAFLADRSPNAYERVIDRLLQSERYGERMALAWMDAARYGDSSVYHADGRRDMWLWRDWVINAYNHNMPFDQFTVEQLAGDLIPEATVHQKIASGFNRNHGTTDEGGVIAEEYRVEYVVDRVKTTGNVWLGLTMECGQCHDHKYDPISQKEYYGFYAYFNRTKDAGMQTRGGNAPPLVKYYSPERKAEIEKVKFTIASEETIQKEKKPGDKLVQEWLTEKRANPEPATPEATPWHQIGPFKADNYKQAYDKGFGLEKDPKLDKEYDGKKWEKKDYKDGEVINFPQDASSAWYVHRTLTVPKKEKYNISLGSDDGIKVWVNGKEVLAKDVQRGAAADQEKINVELQEGENTVMLKIINNGGGCGFYFRVMGSGIPKEILDLFPIAEADLKNDQKDALVDYYAKNLWEEGKERTQRIAGLKEQEKNLNNGAPTCMVMEDQENPRKTYVLSRGHYASPIKDEEIQPGVPVALHPLAGDAPPNRLGLARWLTDPKHPLTARVAINRYWQMFFGTGIVATDTDFGTRGEWPSHPDLLDWMARDFVDNGWNVKRTIKQILMSATYRQEPTVSREKLERDPQNALLSRAPRLRLQGEFLRDNALMLAGLLNDRVGGPSVKPYQPPRIWNEVSLDGNLRYKRDDGAKLYRRSMYTYWKRSAPSPSMMAFDAPTREKCVVRRQRTNTPLQALVTLNDVQFVEASRLYAERIMREGGDDFADRLNYAFQLATGRPADVVRQDSLHSFYQQQWSTYDQHKDKAEALLKFGDYPRDTTLDTTELATWTTIASIILNLDEVLTKE